MSKNNKSTPVVGNKGDSRLSLLCSGNSKRLFRTSRPGYPAGKQSLVPIHVVDAKVQQYKAHGINTVILLLTDGESWKYYDADLAKLYAERGMRVFRFPIIDFNVPTPQLMLRCVKTIYSCLRGAENSKSWKCSNVVVHCSAGQGRTGLVGSCLSLMMGKAWFNHAGYYGESHKQDDFLGVFWKFLMVEGAFTAQAERDIAAGWKYRTARRQVSSRDSIFSQDWREKQFLSTDSVSSKYPRLSGTGTPLKASREVDPYKKKLASSVLRDDDDEQLTIFDDDFEDEEK